MDSYHQMTITHYKKGATTVFLDRNFSPQKSLREHSRNKSQKAPSQLEMVVCCNQGRKCRDISVIYRRNIVYRRVSTRYFMEKYQSGDIFSRYIGDLAINRQFFSDILRGQHGSTKVKRATVPVTALQCCYSASPFACCREDLNPKPKGLGFTRLPPGLTCPLIHNMQQIYIYLNSLYKENIRIF